MTLSRRDALASTLVGVAVLLYLLWAFEAEVPSLHATRATGAVVLVLGFLASASAVVPTFDRLIHGSKSYLMVTSAIGVVAAVAGILVMIRSSEIGLGVVIASMVVLWSIATTHHVLMARSSDRTGEH
ncbi:MAG TPA: hypothetical protein VLD86_10835 [Ilumatobacteraceae bacterium]|nr:hypothetical protein [Ilumatobacteraceae bacterium]